MISIGWVCNMRRAYQLLGGPLNDPVIFISSYCFRQSVSGNMSSIYVPSYLRACATVHARFNPTLVFSSSPCTARDWTALSFNPAFAAAAGKSTSASLSAAIAAEP